MISLVYSSSPQYDCYGNFEELLVKEFRKQGQKAHSKKIKAKTYFSLSVFIVSLILSKSSIISIKKEDFMTKTL